VAAVVVAAVVVVSMAVADVGEPGVVICICVMSSF